jgi:hypothetical protein
MVKARAIKDKNSKLDPRVFCFDVWLDFEDGDLLPEDFVEIFPDTQMMIFNSFNHTPENPRFRVVIPTTQNMTPSQYEKIWDMIALNQDGKVSPSERQGQI